MISFTCSCGKKYQLPDRVAGREVRCNQCQKTLLVPNQSRDESVVPLDDLNQGGTKPPPVPDAGSAEWKTERENKNDSADHIERELGEQVSLDDLQEKRNQWKWFSFPFLILAVVALLFGVFLGRMSGVSSPDSSSVGTATGETAPDEATAATFHAPDYPASDWAVRREEPIPFVVKTADGKPARIELTEGNPVEAAEQDKKEEVLNVVAAALATEDSKAKEGPDHAVSYRIDSESGETLRMIWPGDFPAALDGNRLKEFRFYLYLSEKANSGHAPGKPNGVEKTLEFSEFRFRLCADTGFVDYVPAGPDKLISIVEHARKDWFPVSIPIQGDEQWKRHDYGLVGPLVVRRIELHFKPTGSGLTLWLDNLHIGE